MAMKKESMILPIAAFTATADNNTQKNYSRIFAIIES